MYKNTLPFSTNRLRIILYQTGTMHKAIQKRVETVKKQGLHFHFLFGIIYAYIFGGVCMKHIVKQVAILSLALMLLITLLPVGVAAADTDTSNDSSATEDATPEAPTEDPTEDPTEEAAPEDSVPEEEPSFVDVLIAKFWAFARKFYHWFRIRVNLVFDMM